MKLIINSKTTEFKNNVNEIKILLEVIQEALKEQNLELSYLVIDGVSIYQDFETYLTEKIETISEIEVVTLELKPLIEETLASAFEYLTKAMDLLKSVADTFYQSPGQQGWNHLADLIEGIDWLLATMNRIDQIEQLTLYLSNYDIWNEYVQTIKGLNLLIIELEQAMINKDSVLIGDLILYEILPIFEEAKEKLRFLVPLGGNHVS